VTQRKNWQWLDTNPRALEVVDQLGVLSDHALADLLATKGVVATNDQVSGWRRSRGIEPSRVRRDLRREYTEAEIRQWIGAYQAVGNLRQVARRYKVPETIMRQTLLERRIVAERG
jgi:hypothetical protein